MKELMVIVGITALGACVGLALRDPAPALPANAAITETAPKDTPPTPTTERRRAEAKPTGARTDEVTRADGSRQVTFYNTDGSRGIRVNYGPERSGTLPQGGYVPTGGQPSYNSGPAAAGGASAGAARSATRC